ncbi:MAG: DUF4365 domain-containing protein [Acidobacteriota bacterium]
MEKSNSFLLAKRAEALATVYLTRRDDLKIHEQSNNYGFDLLVEIKNGQVATGRFFGVEVKRLPGHQKVQLLKPSQDEFRINLKPITFPKDIPFPLCLFIFNMQTDEGYYRWIKEPAFGADNQPLLKLNQKSKFKFLDNKSLDEIIAAVNNWYDNQLKIPA